MAAPTSGARLASARTARRSTGRAPRRRSAARAIQPRRTRRRSHSRRRCGASARPHRDQLPGPAVRSGRRAGRAGRPAQVRPVAPGDAAVRRRTAGVIRPRPRRSARPRRSRQRRVGDTNWTDSSRKTTASTSQARRSSARACRGSPRTRRRPLGDGDWPPLPRASFRWSAWMSSGDSPVVSIVVPSSATTKPPFRRPIDRRRERHRLVRSAGREDPVAGPAGAPDSIEHQPPNEVSVPHRTSTWAMNGFR